MDEDLELPAAEAWKGRDPPPSAGPVLRHSCSGPSTRQGQRAVGKAGAWTDVVVRRGRRSEEETETIPGIELVPIVTMMKMYYSSFLYFRVSYYQPQPTTTTALPMQRRRRQAAGAEAAARRVPPPPSCRRCPITIAPVAKSCPNTMPGNS